MLLHSSEAARIQESASLGSKTYILRRLAYLRCRHLSYLHLTLLAYQNRSREVMLSSRPREGYLAEDNVVTGGVTPVEGKAIVWPVASV